MKYSMRMLAVIVLGGVLSLLFVQAALAVEDETVWVAVNVIDIIKRFTSESYGRMDKKQFDDIVNNNVTNGFFKLEFTAWQSDQGLMRMSESRTHGRSYGYGTTSYYRIEAITRIIVLDDEFVQKHFASQLKE